MMTSSKPIGSRSQKVGSTTSWTIRGGANGRKERTGEPHNHDELKARLEAGTSERTGRSRTDTSMVTGDGQVANMDHSHLRRTYEGTRSDEPLGHERSRMERLMDERTLDDLLNMKLEERWRELLADVDELIQQDELEEKQDRAAG
jgi:hypothetical protein